MRKSALISFLAIMLGIASFAQPYPDCGCDSGVGMIIDYSSPAKVGEEIKVQCSLYNCTNGGGLPTCNVDRTWSIYGDVDWEYGANSDVIYVTPTGNCQIITLKRIAYHEGSGSCRCYQEEVGYIIVNGLYTPSTPNGDSYPPRGVSRNYTISAIDGADGYDWEITGGSYTIVSGDNTTSINIKFNESYKTYCVKVSAVSTCGNDSPYSSCKSVYPVM